MTYSERNEPLGVRICISCDARRGSGLCPSQANVLMPTRHLAKALLYTAGWRLLRGHQVCAACQLKKRVSFPRVAGANRKS